MALTADPIFYHTIRRDSGGKRKLIYVTNSDAVDVTVEVQDMEKPEWIEIEGVYPTAKLTFESGKRTPLIANINTEHQYFPTTRCMDERVRVVLDEKRALDIAISLPEIIDEILPFRGVYAIDFGTTNSVYAYKGRAMDMPHHASTTQVATVSPEIPSAIYFHNVADRKSPKFSIGREALFDIKENSGRTYSYVISAKRRLGQDRQSLILDRLAGQRKEHRQEYHVDEIASFIVRELFERAQDEIGQRIGSVVVTYPPMFSRGQKQALERSLKLAMESRGIEVGEETLIMDLDEANAGAFNHIYGPLLDEFRNFEVTERKVDLLSLDFGGGTVDISLVSVNVTRSQQGRISIETELKGLSGQANWGGDNVTLDVFKILKAGAALAAADSRKDELEKKGTGAAEPAAVAAAADGDDLWGSGGGAADEDIWGTGDEEGKEKKAADEDEDTADIINREPPENYNAALLTLAREKTIVEAMISRNTPAFDAVVEAEQADGSYSGDDPAQARATIIESAIETVLPTQFASYEDVDPFKMEVARCLFHELWHEADMLKIRMSSSAQGTGKVTGVLKKAAKYTGVDPLVFNDVEFTLEALNVRIMPTVEKIVHQAQNLYDGVQVGDEEGLSLVGQQAEQPPLRVLLLGNCASLPLIQKTVNAAFAAEGQTVVFERKNLKKAVACGACEEFALRKEFGKRGLITYSPKGFLDRLPYALGIQHRDLALMGYPNGFCPIFDRGTKVGQATVLDESSAFLIHGKMKDLAIFADYKDGAEPVYVGWIDFAEEAPSDRIPKRVEGDAQPQKTLILQKATSSPEGSFGVKFELMGNREIVATNIKSGTKHVMKAETENWDKGLDPFSGAH